MWRSNANGNGHEVLSRGGEDLNIEDCALVGTKVGSTNRKLDLRPGANCDSL